jgi:hypothetical protein
MKGGEARAVSGSSRKHLWESNGHLPPKPAKLEQYLKQHLLENHPAAPDEEEEPEPTPRVEE